MEIVSGKQLEFRDHILLVLRKKFNAVMWCVCPPVFRFDALLCELKMNANEYQRYQVRE